MRRGTGRRHGRRTPGEADEDVGAEYEQQSGHHRCRSLRGEARQDRRPSEGTDGTGHTEPSHQAPVDVAEPPVGHSGGDVGAEFGQMHGGTGHGGSEAGEEEQRGRGDPVTHPHGAVDELGAEADEGKDEQFAHGMSLSGLKQVGVRRCRELSGVRGRGVRTARTRPGSGGRGERPHPRRSRQGTGPRADRRWWRSRRVRRW